MQKISKNLSVYLRKKKFFINFAPFLGWTI